MSHTVIHGYRNDPALRASFNRLSQETFGLDFEPWYQNGFWGEKYDPHSIALDGEIVANVSVNRIDGLLNGVPRRYVQLGTVMTRPEYRNRGLIRRIMDAIWEECSGCDGLYLYANDSVLDFYPKFGFVRTPERRWTMPLHGISEPGALWLPMENMADWRAFLSAKRELRSASVFSLDTDELAMFYLSQFMRDCVYFIPALKALVIAEADGDQLIIHDVLSPTPVDLRAAAESFGPGFRCAQFAFTPKDTAGLTPFEYAEEDCTFFVRGESLTADMAIIGSFPGISHA